MTSTPFPVVSVPRGWRDSDLPDLSGRIFVITGANRGIGFETALALARHRAAVVMAVRSLAMGEAASIQIRREVPGCSVGARLLDLADLASVRQFAAEYLENHRSLDGLINNAGVMLAPNRRTKDGFELHWGTNHLGHFALTALLLPALTAAPGGRVVTMTSLVAMRAVLNFGDEGGRRYSRHRAYAASKLANLVLAVELARRLAAGGSPVRSMAAHPGYTNTSLMSVSLGQDHRRLARLTGAPGNWIAQPAAMGAWPVLFAAGAPEAVNGGIYAPSLLGVRGHPRAIRPFRSARSRELAERLWVEAEQATSAALPLALAPH